MNYKLMLWTAALALVASPVLAQQSDGALPFDTTRGEASPDTHVPSQQTLMNVIQAANVNPSALEATLEYGELAQCGQCVGLLEHQLLASSNPRVRSIAAWWLVRRPFTFTSTFHHMRTVLETDADATNRARAAEALGGFRDGHAIPFLRTALTDTDVNVRVSAVRALGEINAPGANQGIVQALSDSDASVREVAVQQVLRVSFFRDGDALMGLLCDSSATVRRRAALAVGTLHVTEAVAALSGLLAGDADYTIRQAAAWALGQIGGTEARAALTAQRDLEEESLVRDAIGIALRMR